MDMEVKACLNCQRQIKGRSDKKFCNDYCRNSYNNLQRSEGESLAYIKHINRLLHRNRRLLSELLHTSGQSITRINREELSARGFSFQYFTHQFTTRQAKTYFYCYDLGYLQLDDGLILVVREQEKKGKAYE